MIRQAGVLDPGYLRVGLEELGDLQRILAMTLHAQRQGFQPLQDQKRVEREIAAPMLRSGTTRQRPMKAAGPKASV